MSLLWLTDQRQTSSAVSHLDASKTIAGIDTILAGEPLEAMFNDPLHDSRTPDTIVETNVGVIYTGGKKKVAEHGGFAHNDTNVMLLVAHPGLEKATNATAVDTAQIAPTILKALDLEPDRLQAVELEGTQPLPGLHLGADD